MKIQNPVRRPYHLLASLALGITLTHAAPLAITAEADLDVRENLDALLVPQDTAGAFDAPDLNTRFSNADRNEIIAMRFDLTGHDRSTIASAALRLIAYRANTSSQTLRLYGVTDGATGYNAVTTTEGTPTDDNWPENGTLFSTMPGLEYDANVTTRGVRSDRVTDLGTGAVSSTTAEGAEVLISTAGLKDFLVAHADNVVTILVVSDTVSGNQKRFASREATALFSAGTPQTAGTYAPKLVIDLPGSRIPVTADAQMTEGGNTGNGGGTQINARYYTTVAPGNNEVVALRFDLTGYNPSDIISADVRLVNHRNNSAATLHYYGVIDGATGYNSVTSTEGTVTDDDWAEGGTVFGTMPGLQYDSVISTGGIRSDRTVDLGTLATSSGSNNLNEGTKVVFSNANLINFLKAHPDNVVTILVATDTNSSGQKRFGTKESTVLGAGGTAQPAGTFAPEITLLMANADRDGDGLLNNWEVLYDFDPDNADINLNSISDGLDDTDTDGLTNLQEQTKGTNPTVADTDSDGLFDGVENGNGTWGGTAQTGTNPLVADSDGDGLPDGVEDPSLPFVDSQQPGTDPNSRDSDSDIYSDGAEVTRDSNPTLAEIVPDGAVLEILGTGSAALSGSPLTDPENDIDDTTPAGLNFNWAAVTSSEKPFFGTGVQNVDPQNVSGAFDLFDHKVGPLNDKWLAGVNALTGAHTTVEFAGKVSLTSFTIGAADDRTERDPIDWKILGSNDGTNFTPIFVQVDPVKNTVWSARYQVVRCTLAQATPQYRYIRFLCTRAGEGSVHLNEIEYFGTFAADPAPSDFRITGFTGGPGAGNLSITWTSQPGQSFRLAYSTNLSDGFTETVATGIPADAGGTTTHTFPNPLPAAPKLFFRVEKP